MSSNIKLRKICEFCKQSFIARKVVTRYCSHQCNQRAYKLNEKKEKIYKAQIIEQAKPKLAVSPIVDYKTVQSKEFLTLKEASLLLNITFYCGGICRILFICDSKRELTGEHWRELHFLG